jgi:hypothetical protein
MVRLIQILPPLNADFFEDLEALCAFDNAKVHSYEASPKAKRKFKEYEGTYTVVMCCTADGWTLANGMIVQTHSPKSLKHM